jgi:hypothetical protein
MIKRFSRLQNLKTDWIWQSPDRFYKICQPLKETSGKERCCCWDLGSFFEHAIVANTWHLAKHMIIIEEA